MLFYLGLDLGQRSDYSAVAVVERRDQWRGYGAPTFGSVAVRHVERMSLGTPYPAVVERVREILQSDAMRGRCTLTVDATGVGRPVVDMLRSARLGCEICAVTITGGERASMHGSGWNVPKVDLMGGLRVLLEKGEIKIARDLQGMRVLMRELMDVQARERGLGSVRMGAEGFGQHDDLVTAVSLACWMARRRKDNNGPGRLPGI